MICPNCGSPVPEDSAYCPVCGMPATTSQAQAGATDIAPYQGEAGQAYSQPYQQPPYQQGYQQQGYGGAPFSGGAEGYAASGGFAPPAPMGSARALNDRRSTLMVLLLNIVTCGVYWYIALHEIAEDTNITCGGDREETPGMAVFIVLSLLTGGLYTAWWYYKIGNRLQRNAPRYGLSFKENGTTLLVWNYAGCLLCCAGPIVAMSIIVKNANALAAAYNAQAGVVYQS